MEDRKCLYLTLAEVEWLIRDMDGKYLDQGAREVFDKLTDLRGRFEHEKKRK